MPHPSHTVPATQRVSPLAAAAVLCAAGSFATTPALGKVAFEHGANPLGLLVARFVVAGIASAALLTLRRRRVLTRANAPLFAGLTVAYLVQSLSFFEALTRMDAAPTVIVLYVYPAFVVVGSVLILGDRIGATTLLAVPVSLLGVALCVGFGEHIDSVGVVLALTSALGSATFLLLLERVLASGLGPLDVTALLYVGVAIGFGLLALLRDARLPLEPEGWTALGAIVLVGTLLGTLLQSVGLVQLPATAVALLSTIEPVAGVAVAVTFLGDALSAAQIAGAALVVSVLGVVAISGITRTTPR